MAYRERVGRRAALVALPAAWGALAACGPPQRVEPAPTREPEAQAPEPTATPVRPAYGGTLTLATARDVVTLDPLRVTDVYGQMVLNCVADTLFEVDGAGNVVGRLVEKAENPQPNVYLLTLRAGVRFHDGTAVDAAAVKANLERHLGDPSSAHHGDVGDVTALEVVNRQALRITLRAPSAPFPYRLTGGAGYVLSPTAVRRLGPGLQRNLAGAGSGPFRFGEWRPGSGVVLQRNPSFWRSDRFGRALPYLDGLVLRPVPDENQRIVQLRAGTVDALIGGVPGPGLATLSGAGIPSRSLPGLGWSYVALNTARPPFQSAPARRAFSLAIDRQEIVQRIYGGGEPLDTPVPAAVAWAHDRTNHPYLQRDAERARQELAAAGAPDGFRFTLQIAGGSPQLRSLAELIRDQLRGVGLEAAIQEVDFSTLLANRRSGAFEALNGNWSGDLDPDGLRAHFRTGGSENATRFSHPLADQLLDAARTTLARDRRGDLYRQVQQVLYEEQPYVVYYNTPQIAIARPEVRDFPLSYNGYWGTRDLERTWKT